MLTFSPPIRYFIILGILVIISYTSCTKFVQPDPPTTSISGATVYSNNTSAASVMTGLYSNMIAIDGMSSGSQSIGYSTGLASDELTNYDPGNIWQVQFYQNALIGSASGSSNYYFWSELYSDIYQTNAVLEGVSNSTAVTPSVKQQIEGEAKFMRAFYHFYATNLYGDVPLVTTTNYQTNNSIARTPQVTVYQQIVSDLLDAQSKLSAQFVDAIGNTSTERTRPNQGAATALLARVYLYEGKWDSAAMEATKMINNTSLYSLDSLNAVFLANSTEAIWQLQPTQPGYNTFDAYYYVLLGVPGPGQQSTVAVSPQLLNSFEPGDERYTNWLGAITADSITYYYFPYKYKVWQTGDPVTEYFMMFRLAEQFLIRAEAEAEKNDLTDAVSDLNIIRTRAGLPNISNAIASSQTGLVTAILHERQLELFSEWGHRWFDLKRTNNLNSVLGAPGNVCQLKGGIWSPDWALLPIALSELQSDVNLTQNPGYN